MSTTETMAFVRADGRSLRVVEGFRERVLSAPRTSVQPKPEWTATEYEAAAEKKLRGSRRLVSLFARLGGRTCRRARPRGGCGAGIDCLLLGPHRVEQVTGIDLELSLSERSERGERARRLSRTVLTKQGAGSDLDEPLRRLRVRFAVMDVTRMDFPAASFDLLVSRAALEHVAPIERALAEMARVVRPGRLLRHSIDPFFWLRGCHKGGLVDIPWAHARLRPDEFRRFVAESEGKATAHRRSRHLEGLNQLGLRQWRELFETSPFEILDWREEPSALAHRVLEEHVDVTETLLDGLTPRDLVHSSIKVWLRSRNGG